MTMSAASGPGTVALLASAASGLRAGRPPCHIRPAVAMAPTRPAPRTTVHVSRALKLSGPAASAALTLTYLDPAHVTDHVRAFGPFISGYDSRFSFGGRV